MFNLVETIKLGNSAKAKFFEHDQKSKSVELSGQINDQFLN